MKTFAERLKYAMQKAEMTQTMLAKKSGILAPSISQYIHGLNMPSEERIEALADALNTTVDFLMGICKEQVASSIPMVQVKCLASGSTGNSYALDDGESVLLLEAGISAKRMLDGYLPVLPRVVGCLITHEHMDHAKGAKDLAARGIDLYASSGTFSNLDGIRHPYRKHTIRAGEQFTLGSWIIVPWQAQHDAQEPLGFLLYSKVQKEKVLFATDTYYIPNTFKHLNIILVECNYDPQILEKRIRDGKVVPSMARRLQQSHFSLEHVKDFFRSNDLSNVRQIYLIHISKGNGDPAAFQKAIMQLTGKPVMVF